MGLLPHGYLGGTKSHRGSIIGDKTGKFKIVVHEMTILVRATVFEKYHVDFALKKDTTAEQPRYLVFFKSRDADAITAAFQEFTARKLHRKPSIRQRLAQAKEQSRKQHRELDRQKVKEKERGVEL